MSDLQHSCPGGYQENVYKCENSYSLVDPESNGLIYTKSGILQLSYKEESKLDTIYIRIFNADATDKAFISRQVGYGYNNIAINLLPYGLTVGDIYNVEISKSNNEKIYLKFRYQTN